MDLFLNEYIKKILYGGDTFKLDTKPSNLQLVERKIDNYLLSIYRDLNPKPKDLLKEYKLEDIIKFKKLTPPTNTQTIIYEETYDRIIQKLSNITDYFIYPCRMKCLVEKSSFPPYDIYLKALEKNKKFNQDQKKQLLYDLKKHPNCSLLHFRRLIHILKEMMGNRTDIKYIDSSSGWGDRMIAALLLGVEEYVGYDPNECLTKGHTEIINYFKDDLFGHYSSSNSSKSTSQSTYKSYQVIYKPFENEYSAENQYNNYFDICVSSPPFFTVEIYSEESTQSTSNYKTADDWLYKFLIPSFKKVIKFLKPSGYLCWYIEDRPEYKFLDIFFKTIDNLNICKYIRKIGYKYDDDDKVRYFYIWQKNINPLMKRIDNFDLQKEANFIKSVENYIKENGYNKLFEPAEPENKDSLVPKTVKLTNIIYDIDEYKNDVKNTIQKYDKLYNRFKDTIKHVDILIYRYKIWGILNNISLSVSKKQKLEWKIDHELFGAFYNVDLNNTYGSLFPDLEPNSTGNALFFTPKRNSIVLVNPPYISKWIKWSIRKILDEWLDKAVFHIVIPIWDNKTRKKLGLKEYSDIPEIIELRSKCKEYKLIHNFEFYDGINDTPAFLKDPIHYFMI